MTLPTLFLSHGSPMHAVEPGEVGRAWEALGHTLPRPRAVLMVSAHWETSVPMLTGSPKPQTIHDFGGFPPALYQIAYPAPGAPDLASEVVAHLKKAGIAAGIDGCRGLDHGAWVPLLRMYPAHDVPVVQLSLQTALGPAHHVALGRALAPLADDGVLVVGSGHATHNLRDWMASLARGGTATHGYSREFADWLRDTLAANDTDALVAYRERAPHAVRAHPTDEHFLPIHVAWGAAGPGPRAERFFAGDEAGAIALDSYLFHPAR